MTFKTSNPLPGDFGLVPISGIAGKGISLGQRIIGSGSKYQHAYIVIGNDIVEAEPGGAARDTLHYETAAYSAFPLTDDQRQAIVSAAVSMVGTPYSFVDYAAIGALRLLHFGWIEDYVSASGHMICSQLVAECYRRAGIELFPNRAAGDVVPGDLARLIGAS